MVARILIDSIIDRQGLVHPGDIILQVKLKTLKVLLHYVTHFITFYYVLTVFISILLKSKQMFAVKTFAGKILEGLFK